MPDYLPWSESDLETIARALKRFQTLGMAASADFDRSGEGLVTLSRVDGRIADAPIVIFEIHKLKRTDSDLRAHWVVQIQSVSGAEQILTRHGCVSAGAAIFALAKAEKDVEDGFATKDTFDLAANAYWLRL